MLRRINSALDGFVKRTHVLNTMRKIMKCLIDADLLSYEISASGQYYELEDTARENLIIKPFDSVSEHLDQKIREIVAECNSDEEPTLYLTGDEKLLYQDRKSTRLNSSN